MSSAASIYLSIRLKRRWFIESVIHRNAFNELKYTFFIFFINIYISADGACINKTDFDRSSSCRSLKLFKLVLWRKRNVLYVWIRTFSFYPHISIVTGWWCKMWEHRQMNSNKIIGEECYKWMNSCYLILKCDCQCECQWVILLLCNCKCTITGCRWSH